MTVIDAHQHVWDLDRARYPWLGEQLAPINRSISLEESLPALRRAGVSGTVLVQSADDLDDTRHMLEVERSHLEVRGVVGWVPLDDLDRAVSILDELVTGSKLVGIRSLIHDQPDPDWILRPDVDRGLSLLEERGIPFDFVTSGPEALTRLVTVLERHPALPVVLDHLGKPPIGGDAGSVGRWRELLQTAAGFPNLTAKVSGLYSSVGEPGDWTTESVRPFVHDALQMFGADRLMYGGDWPISNLAGGYDRVWDGLSQIFSDLTLAERDAITAGTATRFYGLDAGEAS